MRVKPTLMQKRQINPFSKSCLNNSSIFKAQLESSRTSLNASLLPKLDKPSLRYNQINILDDDVFQPREQDLSKSFIELDANTSQFRSYSSSQRPLVPVKEPEVVFKDMIFLS